MKELFISARVKVLITRKRNTPSTMSTPGNKDAQKENEKSSQEKFKDIKIYVLNDTEFKITILKTVKEIKIKIGGVHRGS